MNEILEQFDKHGRTASYHYADDTTSEWHLGDEEKRKALALFDAHPELQVEMRKLAKIFLWRLEYDRPEENNGKETQRK